MAVSTQGAPRNFRIPRVTVESRLRVENPIADTGDLLIVAPKTAAAPGIVGDIYVVPNETEARTIFGVGSIGHRMFRAWQAQATFAAVQMMVLANAGTQRVDEIVFTDDVTTAGTLLVTIGSDVIQVPVTSGDDNDAVAAKVVAAINGSDIPLQFTAAVDGTDSNQVNVTSRNGGVVNGTATIAVDENGVGGTTAAVSTATPAAGDYSYAALEAAVSDELFDVIVPCDLGGTAGEVQTLLTNRWNATNARFGVEIQAVKGNATTLVATYGNQNHAYRAYLGIGNGNPSPTYEIAAAAAQQVYARYANDPVLSYNNLPLNGIGAPKLSERFNERARQTILDARIGTVKYDKDGTCRLESMPLAWSPDGGGFYYLSNLFTVTYVGRIFANLVEQYISNFKFTEAEGQVPPGSVRLETIRADVLGLYGQLVEEGIVEDYETFSRNLNVSRPAGRPFELNIVLPVNIANAVRNISLINSWTQ